MNNDTFDSNIAITQGGAINYDYKRPQFSSVVYLSNFAPYGSNVASYPVKIKLKDSLSDEIILKNAASGINYHDTLSLGLYDYDDQVAVLENEDQITINPVDRDISSISGTNAALLNNGIGKFENLIFISKPGSGNILYQASSKAIDRTIISSIFGSQVSNNTLKVNFRFCKPGEIITSDDKCSECSAGTYSLDWNSTE